jgi:hypothetical protein
MNHLKIFALTLLALSLSCNSPSPTDGSPPAPTPTAAPLSPPPVADPVAPPAAPAPSPKKDPRSLAELHVAACTGLIDASHPDGWRCAGKKPVTFAATGNTPIVPVSWTVPAWFVDPQNVSTTASDQNDCVTAVTACIHWSEIAVHRFGFSGACPAEWAAQNTAITFLSSHTDDTDPVLWCPIVKGNAVVSIRGAAPSSVPAVFTLVTAKNTNAGTNALLVGSFSAGVPAVGKMVQNTTGGKSSRAWIYKTAGGANWTITQPLALGAVGTPPPQAEVDTWVSLDTVNVLTPVSVNLVKIAPTPDVGSPGFYLYQMTFFDPSGPNTNVVEISGSVNAVECSSQRRITYSNSLGASQNMSNVFGLGVEFTATGRPVRIAGALASPGVSAYNAATEVFDGDIIVGTLLFLGGNNTLFGNVAIDNQVSLFNGALSLGGIFYAGNGVIYGTGANTVNVVGNSKFVNFTGGTYVAAFTAPGLVTGIQINGAATGSCNTGADPAVIHNATTTPAHLDAACGAGTGLGGIAFKLGGAMVSNVQ